MGKECFITRRCRLISHSSTLNNFLIIKSKANGPKPQTLGPVALDERSWAFPQILKKTQNLKP
jgi:hypothetical protein